MCLLLVSKLLLCNVMLRAGHSPSLRMPLFLFTIKGWFTDPYSRPDDLGHCLLGHQVLKFFFLKKVVGNFAKNHCCSAVCVCNTNKEIRAQLLPKCFQRISGWSSSSSSTEKPKGLHSLTLLDLSLVAISKLLFISWKKLCDFRHFICKVNS